MNDRERVEKNLNDVVDLIDARFLRSLQAEMFHCAAKCFEGPHVSRQQDHQCYQQCAVKVNRASSVVEHCMEEYQGTIKHCLDSCADSVRYRPDVQSGKELSSETETMLNACSKKCVDAFVANKDSVVKQVATILKSFKD